MERPVASRRVAPARLPCLNSLPQSHPICLRSISMIDPLLTDAKRSRPEWISWLAHVRLLTFCLQHSFTKDDLGVCDRLAEEYFAKFTLVPSYRHACLRAAPLRASPPSLPRACRALSHARESLAAALTRTHSACRGFAKPKHHCIRKGHLSKYLRLYGPFRFVWCMPYEAFLQVLKRLFDMQNYKIAPYSVGTLWARKRAYHLSQGGGSAWQTESFVASTDIMQGQELVHACAISSFLHTAATTVDRGIYAARMLHTFAREKMEVSERDWVLLMEHGQGRSWIAQVSEMAHVWKFIVGQAANAQGKVR